MGAANAKGDGPTTTRWVWDVDSEDDVSKYRALWWTRRPRVVALVALVAMVAAGCTTAAEPSTDAASPGPTHTAAPATTAQPQSTSAERRLVRATADLVVPEVLQLSEEERSLERLEVRRIDHDGTGWRLLGELGDGRTSRPVLLLLDDAGPEAEPTRVRAQEEFELPSEVQTVSGVRWSEDRRHVLAVGHSAGGNRLGLVWDAATRSPAAEPVPGVSSFLDVAEVQGGLIAVGGASSSDQTAVRPAAWELTTSGVKGGAIDVGADRTVLSSVSVVDGQLEVWGNLPGRTGAVLLRGPATSGVAGLEKRALPRGMGRARAIHGVVETPEAGRFAYGASASASSLMVRGLWREEDDGTWEDLSDRFGTERTGEILDAAASAGGESFHAGVGYDDRSAIWLVVDGEVQAQVSPAQVVGLRVDPDDRSSVPVLRLFEDELHGIDYEPLIIEDLPRTLPVDVPSVAAVTDSRLVVTFDDEVVVSSLEAGREVGRASLFVNDAVDLADGSTVLAGFVEEEGQGTDWYLARVTDDGIEMLATEDTDGTSRMSALIADGDDLLAVGHDYSGGEGPQLLARRIGPDATVSEVADGTIAELRAIGRRCTSTTAIAFDGRGRQGLLIRTDDGLVEVDLELEERLAANATRCVALEDGRTLLVSTGTALLVDATGVQQRKDLPALWTSGLGEGAVVKLEGEEHAIFTATDSSDLPVVAVLRISDLEVTDLLPLDSAPHRSVTHLVGGVRDGALVVQVWDARRVALEVLTVGS